MDRKGLYKSRSFVATGADWDSLSERRQLCLGSQTSLDRLYWLPEILRRWSGPISITLFVPDVEFGLAEIYLKYLWLCFPSISEQVEICSLVAL